MEALSEQSNLDPQPCRLPASAVRWTSWSCRFSSDLLLFCVFFSDSFGFLVWFLWGFSFHRMMSDYKVEMINDGMQEFFVDFHGPNDSMLLFILSLSLSLGFLFDFAMHGVYWKWFCVFSLLGDLYGLFLFLDHFFIRKFGSLLDFYIRVMKTWFFFVIFSCLD